MTENELQQGLPADGNPQPQSQEADLVVPGIHSNLLEGEATDPEPKIKEKKTQLFDSLTNIKKQLGELEALSGSLTGQDLSNASMQYTTLKKLYNKNAGEYNDLVKGVQAAKQPNVVKLPSTSLTEQDDVVGLIDKATDLSKRTKSVSVGIDPVSGAPLSATEPDQDAIDESNRIKDELKAKGYSDDDVKSIYTDFKDFPKDAFRLQNADGSTPYSQGNLLKLKKENPIEYQNTLNNLKTTFTLYDKAGRDVANQFNQLHYASKNFSDFYDKIKAQQDIIHAHLEGDDQKKALGRLQQTASIFINPASPSFVKEYQADPSFAGKIDPNQYAGLMTMRLFDPEQYNAAVKMLAAKITPTYDAPVPASASAGYVGSVKTTDSTKGVLSQETVDQRIGKETILQRLSSIGRSNALTYLNREQFNINNAWEKSQDADEKEKLSKKYLENQAIINGVNDDIKKDDARYPLLAKIKLDQLVKRVYQSEIGLADYGALRFGKGIDATKKSLENNVTALFGSDEDNALLQMQRSGEAQNFENEMYLPPSITGNKNIWSKYTLYKNVGFLGDIGSIVAQSYGLGGLGAGKFLSAAMPMYTTSQNDFYSQAVAEGVADPSVYANTHATIMALAGMINPDINIVRRALGANTVAGKMIAGIDDATWNKVVSENTPLLQKFQNSITSVGKEALKMGTVYGAGTSLANDLADKGFFNKDISGKDMLDHAVESAKEITIGSLALLGLNGITNFKTISPEAKARMWEIGDNADIASEKIDEAVAKGDITTQQGEQRKQVVKTVAGLIDRVPAQKENGQPLSDKERSDYLYNLFIKEKAKKLKNDLPEVQKEKLDAIGAEADNNNNIIISGQDIKKQDEVKSFDQESLFGVVQDYKNKYREQYGIPEDVEVEKAKAAEERAKKIAADYEALPDDDSKNPQVIEAYTQLGKEVQTQYDYMTKDLGITTEFTEGDPYENSKQMVEDVTKNKHLFVYKGGEDHPLLGSKTADDNGITLNEKFRAVHDFFGHAVEGNQFGKHGEERAWVAHSRMFSPTAQRAMTTETRGQNSWVNFSGKNEVALKKIEDGNKLIKEGKTDEGKALVQEGKKEFQFAIQKVALLPEEHSNWRVYEKKTEATEAPKGSKIYTQANIGDALEDASSRLGVEGKVIRDAANVVRVLGKVMPDAKVVVHDSPASFAKAAASYGGGEEVANSNAFFVGKDNSIHLNMEAVKSNTVLHEGVHPILEAVEKGNPGAIDSMFDELQKTKGAEKYIKFGKENYEGAATKEEAITEFLADVADGKVKITDQNRNAIRNFIDKVLKALGFDIKGLTVKLNDDSLLKELAGALKDALSKGEAIDVENLKNGDVLGVTNGDISGFERGAEIKLQKDDLESKDGKYKIERFPSLFTNVERGDIKQFDGKKIQVTFADRLVTGRVDLGNGIKQNKLGGIFYPSETGKVWASGSETAANTIANNLVYDENGKAYLGIATLSDTAHMSNYNSILAVSELIKNAIDNGDLKRSEVVERINRALSRKVKGKMVIDEMDRKGIRFTQKMSSEEISNELKRLFTPEAMTFDFRKTFLESLLGNAEKKTDLQLSGVPTFNQVAEMLAEPALKNVQYGDLVAIVEVNGKATVRETSKESDGDTYHDSYPWVIEAPGGVKMTLLNHSYSIEKAFPSITNKQGKTLTFKDYQKKYGDKARSQYIGYAGARSTMSTILNEKPNVKAETKSELIKAQYNPAVKAAQRWLIEPLPGKDKPMSEEEVVKKVKKQFGVSEIVAKNIVEHAKREKVYRPISGDTGAAPSLPQTNLLTDGTTPDQAKTIDEMADQQYGKVEQPADVTKTKSWLKKGWDKFFTAAKGMPDWFLPLIDRSKGQANLYMRHAAQTVSKVKAVAKKIGFEDWDAFDDALRSLRYDKENNNTGIVRFDPYRAQFGKSRVVVRDEDTTPRALLALPEEMQPLVVAMRNQIDGISRNLIINGLVTPEQAMVIENNLGKYMHRSYSASNDKSWVDHIKPEVKKDAFKFLFQQEFNKIKSAAPDMPDADIMNQAGDNANRLLKQIIDGVHDTYKAEKFNTIKGKDLNILEFREDIPEPIRKLLGEYTDPTLNFMITISKMASLQGQAKFLQGVRDQGMGTLFFEEHSPNRPASHSVQVASEGSETWSPLNGLYTTPEVKEFLHEQQHNRNALVKLWLKTLGLVRWGKTVGSPITQVKNFVSNIGFAMMSGHYRISQFTKGSKYAFDNLFQGGKLNDADINEVISENLIGQNVNARELKDMLSKNTMDKFLVDATVRPDHSAGNKIGNAITKPFKWVIKGFGKAYATSDDMWKIYGYMNERADLSKALYGKRYDELSAGEQNAIRKEAAERVKNTYPTYDRVWEGAAYLSKNIPLFGNFLAFQAESLRVTLNHFQYIAKDFKSKDTTFMAARRLIGTGAYLSLRTVLLKTIASQLGIGLGGLMYPTNDDNEDQKLADMNRYCAPFQRSGDKLPVNLGNGEYEVYDLTSLDPYGIWFKTMNAATNGDEGIQDAGLGAALHEFFSPFIEEEMVYKSIDEATHNTDGKVYGEHWSWGDKFLGAASYVLKKNEPSIIDLAKRIEKNGLAHESWSALGAKPIKMDVKKAFSIKLHSVEDKFNSIHGEYFRGIMNANGDQEKIKEVTDRANGYVKDIIKELNEDYQAALRLGAPEDVLDEAIKKKQFYQGFTKQVKTGIVSGDPQDIFNGQLGKKVKQKLIKASSGSGNDLGSY